MSFVSILVFVVSAVLGVWGLVLMWVGASLRRHANAHHAAHLVARAAGLYVALFATGLCTALLSNRGTFLDRFHENLFTVSIVVFVGFAGIVLGGVIARFIDPVEERIRAWLAPEDERTALVREMQFRNVFTSAFILILLVVGMLSSGTTAN